MIKPKLINGCCKSVSLVEEFERVGWDAWTCDTQPSEGWAKHIQDDILNHLHGLDCSTCRGYGELWYPSLKLKRTCPDCEGRGYTPWSLGIFHPDCTTKANSGVRWLFDIPGRYEQMLLDCDFMNKLLSSRIPMICVEHPIIHKYAKAHIIREYTQIIQPHYFVGSNESKATCLWLVGLPALERTQWLDKSEIKQSVWRHPPSPERKTNRARNSPAVSRAMAEQWGLLWKLDTVNTVG